MATSLRGATWHSAVVGALIISALVTAGEARGDAVEEAGDVIQIVLPIAGFLSTFVAGSEDGTSMWDREGTKQGFLAIGGAILTTRVWKLGAQKLRPSSGARSSYPSGHTTAAVAGAAFIDHRYGWKWGVPAYAGAAIVGYSRVTADAHFADDVTAGASIGLMFNWLFTRPRGDAVPLLAPTFDERGVGFRYNQGGAVGADGPWKPRYMYTFAFGPAYLRTNEVASPSDGGTPFDLNHFNKIDNPTTTAAVDFTMPLAERHFATFYWNPFESRDTGTFSEDVEFVGVTFPAGAPVASAWRLYDLRGRYGYDLVAADEWLWEVGAGLMYQNTTVALKDNTTSSGALAKVRDSAVLPTLHTLLEYSVTPSLAFGGTVEGMALGEDHMLDATVYGSYRFGKNWAWAVGYEYYGREIKTDELLNRVEYNVPYMAVTYGW